MATEIETRSCHELGSWKIEASCQCQLMSEDVFAKICSFQNTTICHHATNSQTSEQKFSVSGQSQLKFWTPLRPFFPAPVKYTQAVSLQEFQSSAQLEACAHLGLASVSGFWAQRRSGGLRRGQLSPGERRRAA